MSRFVARSATRALGLIAGLALVFALAACGTSGGGGGNGGTTSGLTEDDAMAFSGFATASVDFQMGLYADPAGIVPSGFGSCVTENISGDSDSDGIPDTATYTYDCTQAVDFVDASGSVEITDTGDGVLVEITNFTLGFGSGGGSFSYDGTASVSQSGGVYTSTIDLEFSFTADGESATFTIDYTQTFTPTGVTADPFDEGTLAFAGSISVSDNTDTYTMDVDTSPDLAIDASCPTGNIRSGSAVYTDNFNNSLSVTFTNCNATVQYNGAAL